MGSLCGFVGRHVGVLLAVLLSSTSVGLEPTRLARPRVVLPEHDAHIVAFSPDSRVILTDGASGGYIRDTATGRVLARLMRNGPDGPVPATDITEPRFTADGRHVIVQLGGPRFGGGPTLGSARPSRSPSSRWRRARAGRVRGGRLGDLARLGPAARRVRGLGRRLDARLLPRLQRRIRAEGDRHGLGHRRGEGRMRVPGCRPWRSRRTEPRSPTAITTTPALAPAFPTIRTVRPGRTAGRRVPGHATCAGLGAGPAAFSADGKLLAARVSGDARGVRHRSPRRDRRPGPRCSWDRTYHA